MIFESGESRIALSVSLSAAATAILEAFGTNLRIRRRLRICNLLQSKDFESHALSTQPTKLNNRQMPVKNKAATYANNLPMQFSKMAPMTNRLNFVSNNLEQNKLKASTLICMLQIAKHKATLCLKNAFQKIARYIELENF